MRVRNVLAEGRAGNNQAASVHIGAEEVLVELIDLIATRMNEEAL